MNALHALKSGTDIRGIASEGVAGENVNLTDSVVEDIMSGFVHWLVTRTGMPAKELSVAVGHDSRVSAERIRSAVADTLTDAGITVLDCGLASTPAMFFTTIDYSADAAVQITASHHPWNRNGLKFFLRGKGGLESGDITEILQYAGQARDNLRTQGKGGIVPCPEFMKLFYSERLKTVFEQTLGHESPLSGFKIAVDAGNGAGGFYAEQVLAPLGADVSGSVFLEPDGTFPNHVPNPEDKTAMESIRNAVLRSGSDLGVIFDTDVDRAAVVDRHGNEINKSRLIALASAIALADNPGGTIVTDSVTSRGLKGFIENTLGGRHHRFKRGYKNVISEAVWLNESGINAPLAIETSGHAAFRENLFLDDGAYLVTKVILLAAQLRKEGKTLSDIIDSLASPDEEAEVRLLIDVEDFTSEGQRRLEQVQRYAEEHGWWIAPDSHEGIRVDFGEGEGDGWFLLRLSVHDPILVLNIESYTAGGAGLIRQKFNCAYS